MITSWFVAHCNYLNKSPGFHCSVKLWKKQPLVMAAQQRCHKFKPCFIVLQHHLQRGCKGTRLPFLKGGKQRLKGKWMWRDQLPPGKWRWGWGLGGFPHQWETDTLAWHEGRARLGTGWALRDATLALPPGPAGKHSATCCRVEVQEAAGTVVKIIQTSPLALPCWIEVFLGCCSQTSAWLLK